MGSKSVLFTGLILSIVSLTGYFLFAAPETVEVGSQENLPLTEVKNRNIVIKVRTLGTLEAQNSHMVSSEIKGTGAKIIYLAPNGKFVAGGEILVRFDPKPFEDSIEELSNKLESLAAAVRATRQLVEWEKKEAEQRIATTEYHHNVAGLDLKRLIEGEGPLKLAQLSDELDKADLELKHYQAYEVDLRALEKEGIVNPLELDRINENIGILKDKYRSAKRRFDSYQKYVLPVMIESGRAKVKNTELSIEQVKQSSVHKIANAEATSQQAKGQLKAVKAALKKAENELGKTVIRAPLAGLLIHYEAFRSGEMRTPREGDTVIVNQPIMYLPDISSLAIKSRVRETDLFKIKVGQKATILVEAFPEDRFDGGLAFVGALAKKQSNRGSGGKYFQAVFSLNNGDERLRPGMSAQITVHVASLRNIPTIPIQSVFRDDGGDYCYLWNSVMYEKRYVTIGQQNEDFVEIKKGLEVGASVSLVEPESVL